MTGEPGTFEADEPVGRGSLLGGGQDTLAGLGYEEEEEHQHDGAGLPEPCPEPWHGAEYPQNSPNHHAKDGVVEECYYHPMETEALNHQRDTVGHQYQSQAVS